MPREQLTDAGAPRLPDGMSTITVNVQGERVDELVTDSPVIGVVLGQQDMAARHLTRYKSVQRISPWLNALGRPAQERGEGLTMRLDSLEVMGEAESMRVMRMQGDDMAPAIMPGDDLLVDTSKTRAVHGRVFVVAVGDSALVRRCIMSSKGPHWRGSPDGHWNEIEDARIVGQVLRLCREL
jgi:SOS-response transcriptional repressor LexA